MKWILVGIIVVCNACGDLLNTAGMKHHGEVRDFRPRAIPALLLSMAKNVYIIGGIAAMSVAFFALMSLLSVAELSFAIPATAASYMVETLLAKYLLGEHISPQRWLGASLVTCGVLLLAV